MKKLLSGNEAAALGAYHAGVMVATSYPGTPATEIVKTLSQLEGVSTQWSINEKVALEVAMGAAYSGVRAMTSMKHVGLNVAADPLFAASTIGTVGGLVVVSCDDPGYHSSQGEQDNRYYAKFAKIPMLEPTDSQEAYEIMVRAFDISERFDTPLLFRSTTRISLCRGVVRMNGKREPNSTPPAFHPFPEKLVMVPSYVGPRRQVMEERLKDLRDFVEEFPLNEMIPGDRSIGIISSGVAYQHAREVFRGASFLKLVTTYPVPEKLIRRFADQVDKVIVVEELEPFLEQEVLCLGIPVVGKELFPAIGELNADVVERAAMDAGLIPSRASKAVVHHPPLPPRPPRLCAGCPHTAALFVLRKGGFIRSGSENASCNHKAGCRSGKRDVITPSDIGCYTLGVYKPLQALDTTACMGASIGHASGLEKAGVPQKAVAVIGDSTFMHSGITGLINAVYNQSNITVVILDNRTTAMTGLQGHPGTGILSTGAEGGQVELETLVKGIGVEESDTVNAFDVKAIESALARCLDRQGPSVIIVRGPCALQVESPGNALVLHEDECTRCGLCLRTGCPAIALVNEQPRIEASLCMGEGCAVCAQICPTQAIRPTGTGRDEI